MSYLSLLTAFFNKSIHDKRLFPTHISLYVTLFQHWNLNKFNNPLGVVREEIMLQSKIGSKATYHKCMRDLHELNYLTYQPSFSPYQSSTVHMIRLTESFKKINSSTKNEQVNNLSCTENEPIKKEAYIYNNTTTKNKNLFIDIPVQLLNPSVNNRSPKKGKPAPKKFQIPTLEAVKLFFEKSGNLNEAERFYNYYSANGWVVGGGKTSMKDWHAAARNWILNSQNYRPKETRSTGPGNLHVNNDKNYAEPL